MKTFHGFLEEAIQLRNPHVHYAWQMIESEVNSALRYINMEHQPEAVMKRLKEAVKTQLAELDMYLGGS